MKRITFFNTTTHAHRDGGYILGEGNYDQINDEINNIRLEGEVVGHVDDVSGIPVAQNIPINTTFGTAGTTGMTGYQGVTGYQSNNVYSKGLYNQPAVKWEDYQAHKQRVKNQEDMAKSLVVKPSPRYEASPGWQGLDSSNQPYDGYNPRPPRKIAVAPKEHYDDPCKRVPNWEQDRFFEDIKRMKEGVV